MMKRTLYAVLVGVLFIPHALQSAVATVAEPGPKAAAKQELLTLQPGKPLFDILGNDPKVSKLSEPERAKYLKAERAKFDDPAKVGEEIARYGFKQVAFKTEDGVTLHGYLLIRPDAVHNVVMDGGFHPGLGEGMTSFFHLFQEKTNFLIFSKRGHGKSEGRFWTYLGEYGKQEYKDVISALKFMKEKTGKKSFLFAYCMGGLHSAHALIKMSENNTINDYVLGFMCDSAASSLKDIQPMLITHALTMTLPKALGYRPTEAQKSLLMYWLKLMVGIPMSMLQGALIDPGLEKNHPEVRLQDKIHKIKCPIIYFHSEFDSYINSKGTQELAKASPMVTELILFKGETNHFTHHFNPKWIAIYLDRISAFMKFCQ